MHLLGGSSLLAVLFLNWKVYARDKEKRVKSFYNRGRRLSIFQHIKATSNNYFKEETAFEVWKCIILDLSAEIDFTFCDFYQE